MNLLRLLMLAVAAYAVWQLLKASARKTMPPATPHDRSKADEHYEAMARCTICGTHLPAHTLSRTGRCGRCGQ